MVSGDAREQVKVNNGINNLMDKLNASNTSKVSKYSDLINDASSDSLDALPKFEIPSVKNSSKSSAMSVTSEDNSAIISFVSDGPRRWAEDEDERLKSAIALYGDKNWKQIASFVGTRDNVQCLQRWKKSLCPGIVKGTWSEDEDDLLRIKYAEKAENPELSWAWVASFIPGRNAKQCRERWNNYLDASIKKDQWNHAEDQRLLELSSVHGTKWATIARNLPGRTENSVKVRYNSIMKTHRRHVSMPIRMSHAEMVNDENVIRPAAPRLVHRSKSDSAATLIKRYRDDENNGFAMSHILKRSRHISMSPMHLDTRGSMATANCPPRFSPVHRNVHDNAMLHSAVVSPMHVDTSVSMPMVTRSSSECFSPMHIDHRRRTPLDTITVSPSTADMSMQMDADDRSPIAMKKMSHDDAIPRMHVDANHRRTRTTVRPSSFPRALAPVRVEQQKQMPLHYHQDYSRGTYSQSHMNDRKMPLSSASPFVILNPILLSMDHPHVDTIYRNGQLRDALSRLNDPRIAMHYGV